MPQYYHYGLVDPSRPGGSHGAPKEPILYRYDPATPEPPPPPPTHINPVVPAPAAPAAIQVGISIPTAGQQPAQVQYVMPQVQTYHPPARMSAVAQPPVAAVAWQGATRTEINTQNIAIANATGATRPQTLVPYKPADGQQWWCRELDSSYTLRTTTDIMENLQPGRWVYSSSGYPYFIRQPAPA
ncbi:hypothetical protein LOZ12_000307 [Ophidiomyces ophidiicola]|uniref:Uncharacterized protein n=1 Tax=Ophidiomyces ophidiicola TaxID=1387563 RepID=A0ACB8V432_9EURO|nr:uncharacterized protein LOZ57_000760 [Ophidiomyces ophidiicola]KAI1944757.1 hypothetical protein LOZ62_004035 [Ophidiomyces ophidiicola]KAI1952681.1 hypothetical protein LOZ57_000760 [Ophidiomyces ophidiicola]KAI1975854.1 hypothetical protein LOZ56_000446 [Ophidiomyces ophidiicola]KAI2012082.1 hypothetical protein LOZ50_000404 [Ophidiomyces ophidiicola]KAI2026583.1 hypothetical protein LOZ45_003011 [Ophidiomyces ophidiicola]